MGDCVSRSNCCDYAFFLHYLEPAQNHKLSIKWVFFFWSENFLLNGKSQVSSFYKPNTKKFQALMGIRNFPRQKVPTSDQIFDGATYTICCAWIDMSLNSSYSLSLEVPLPFYNQGSPTMTHSHSGLHTVSCFSLQFWQSFLFLL